MSSKSVWQCHGTVNGAWGGGETVGGGEEKEEEGGALLGKVPVQPPRENLYENYVLICLH